MSIKYFVDNINYRLKSKNRNCNMEVYISKRKKTYTNSIQ